MKKFCELCKSIARIYCDSDQASLCWSCDSKVHSANFLVARHSRNLLCRVCQSPTPWTASGEKLGPSTASVCEKCVVDSTSDEEDDREESQGGNDVEDDDDYDGDEDGENELEMEDEEDGDDNQVVPLCSTPPPAPSSSSSEEFSYGVSVKRKRENVADLSSEDDDTDCSSVHKNHRKAVATDGIESNRATLHNFFPSSTEAIVERLKNFRHRENISGDNDAGPVVDVSKATRTVGLDLNSSDSS